MANVAMSPMNTTSTMIRATFSVLLLVLPSCGADPDGRSVTAPASEETVRLKDVPESAPDAPPLPVPPASAASAAPECLEEIQLINELEVRLAQTELALEVTRHEVARYKSGLERAVEELNAQRSRGRVTARPRPAPRMAPAKPEATRIYPLGEPTITPVGDQILIAGRFWNSEEREVAGRVRVELLLDGRTISSATQRLHLASKRSTSFAVTFSIGGREGRFSTRTEFIPDT